MKHQTPWPHRLLRGCLSAALLPLVIVATLRAAPSDPWTRGTGLKSNITLGALKDPSVNAADVTHRPWPDLVDYDVSPGSWTYDVYVPPGYDGTKPYGVMVYITSDNNTGGVVLQAASNEKNLIWISPRNIGNAVSYPLRFGASLLALYRAKELFNIDARRVYTSGKSGGARVASALAFLHPEIIKGTAPSSGVCLPRLSEVSPDYLTKPTLSNTPESFYDYSDLYFIVYDSEKESIHATARTQKLRSYIMGRENDYREEYFVESFHCAYEPQGQACFLYNAPGEHTDANDAEMKEAIDYLDRDDLFPVNANITAGAGGFAGMTNISQSGASAVEATTGGKTTYTLAPTLSAVAAAKTNTAFYWDNPNGSTVRWLWEVKNAAPTNQKTSFGLWFANETWGGGVPTSVTAGSNPGILITITQNGTQNRIVISARPDSGGETVFYDGTFSFSSAYATWWTNPQTGYLTGTGSPVEMRMDLNQNRWQLTFNGIVLGTQTSISSGTHVSRDNKRSIYGYWDSVLSGGTAFWKHDPFTSWVNTWSPFTKSIFTAATGALSGTGTAPSPMELRYVVASDPGLPDPPQPGPTGLAASSSNGVVNLTWNAVAGATGYTIQRSSVSGGPYTTIQSGISGTSFTDSNVTVGNIYYYTIFATTASGDTATVSELAAGAGFQVVTWTGGDTDNNWQSAANWNTPPVAGDTLVFAGSTRLANTNNHPANTAFSGVSFSGGAGAFTLGGNAISLTGNITNNGANTQTVNLPMALASGTHDVTTSSGTLALGGVISGSGSLSKTGSGMTTLVATNNYSGGTTISGGTLAVAKANGTHTNLGTGSVTVNAGGVLRPGYTATNTNLSTTANAITLAGGSIYADDANQHLSGAITVSPSGVLGSTYNNGNNSAAEKDKGLALDGVVSGSGALTVQHTRLSTGSAYHTSFVSFSNNSNSYSGTITINENTTTSEGGVYLGVNGGTALQNATVATSPIPGTNLKFGSSPIVFKAGLGSATIGAISGSGPLVLTGYDQINHAYGTDAIALTVGSNNATTTYSGVISGLGNVTKTGTGTLALAGASTFSGGVTLSAGTLTPGVVSVGSTGSITSSAIGTGTLTLAGGTLQMNNKTLYNALAVTGSAIIDEVTNNGVLAGPASGSGSLTLKNTSGTALSLQVTNGDWSGFTGTITYNGGVSKTHNLLFGSTTTGTWDLSHATLVAANTSNGTLSGGVVNANLTIKIGTLSGGGILDSGNSGSTTNYEIGARGEDSVFSGVVKNAGSTATTTLTKVGGGLLTLSGANTYKGPTVINGGTLAFTGTMTGTGALSVNSTGALGGLATLPMAVTVDSGGAIAPGVGGVGTLTLSGGLTLNTGAVLAMDLAGTATSDKIAVSGAFAASGTTTINLTALGSFAGSGTYPLITGATGISKDNFALGTTPSGYVCTLSASGGTLSLTVTVMTPVESWRSTYFGTTANSGNAADNADPDGDGMTNAQEYAAGTNPTNAASLLKVTGLTVNSDGSITVSFLTVSGKTYRVERSDTLHAGSWTTLSDNIPGTGGTVQVTDLDGALQPKRFYRLVLQ